MVKISARNVLSGTVEEIKLGATTAHVILDVGGAADVQVMANALEVINSDPSVRSILVNIFGGIVRCDDVARGIVKALEQVDIGSQIVLRLDGTNAEAGHEILAPHVSDRLVVDETMLGAARRAVALAGGDR